MVEVGLIQDGAQRADVVGRGLRRQAVNPALHLHVANLGEVPLAEVRRDVGAVVAVVGAGVGLRGGGVLHRAEIAPEVGIERHFVPGGQAAAHFLSEPDNGGVGLHLVSVDRAPHAAALAVLARAVGYADFPNVWPNLAL